MTPDPGDFSTWPSYPVADAFRRSFDPEAGVEYDWVYDYAVARYAATLLHFKELDDKALAIITYIGSGMGIFTLGALAAVANAKLPQAATASAIPSIICAFLALWYAKLARKTVNAPTVPTVRDTVIVAEAYRTKDRAKAAFLPKFNMSMELFRDLFEQKGRQIDIAMNWTLAAVGCLILPVVATLIANAISSSPTSVTLTVSW